MGLRLFVLRASLSAALCVVLAGCGITPASGPLAIGITTEAFSSVPYAVVKLDPASANILARTEPATLAGAFTDQRPPSRIVFGIGDTVSVTIFEAAAGGLFIPIEAGVRPGNFVTLPDQTVDNDGNISVPYAGTLRAAGRTNVEIQNEVVARIRNRAIEPQVVVSLSNQKTSLVSVFGEVGSPVRYPAAPIGAQDRITDAITRAGGIRDQGYATWVTLERKGHRATVPFANLIYQPANNIFVQPGDRIYVYQEQQKYLAFGATGLQGEFTFDAWRINLAEAVGKASGLLDLQADPGSVFLYRREPREVAEALGVDLKKFPEDQELIPIIFSISFRDPGGYFIATTVQMKNQDVIFAANAQSVEVTKFLQYLQVIMTTTSEGVALREQIKATKDK
jgi:polysaccharide export outer membrane protein